MSEGLLDDPLRVVELRRAFDLAFAVPPPEDAGEVVDLLAIRLGGDSYGVKVSDLSAVTRAGRVVPVPSSLPGLLGLVRLRGAPVPVFSLAAILGYGRSAGPTGWLALCGTQDPLALDLGELESYVQVPDSELYAPGHGAAPRRHVNRLMRIGTAVRAIIEVASVVESIKEQIRRGPAPG